ncbi:MAG: hypothetical protein ACRENI_15280 [Gemmatimonadaceae bacterium]
MAASLAHLIAAQLVVQLAAGEPSADSAAILSSARDAQAAFERVRFQHLPWTGRSGGGECDERVGRFCLWHSGDEDAWTAPPEKPGVRQERARLIDRLRSAVNAIPGDGWIVGQLVRYLLEADRAPEALAAARRCAAERWWCRALEGFAYHSTGRYADAEAAFDRAVDEMPADERATWLDLSLLFEGDDADIYERADSLRRTLLVRRMWWLADPLYVVPGNGRLSEHFARLVMDRLQERARSPEGMRWGRDMRELLLRYGWPVGWERIRPLMHETGRPATVAHHARGSRDFLPPLASLDNPRSISLDDWRLDDDDGHSEYGPGYAITFAALPHQFAMFPRGDSAVFVARFSLSDSTGSAALDAGIESAMFVAVSESAQAAHGLSVLTDSGGWVRVTAASRPAVVSIEALDRRERRAWRARHGIGAALTVPGRLALSDVLLVRGDSALPRTLDEALPVALTTTGIAVGERVGLYWELFDGAGMARTVTCVLRVRRSGRGWVSRFAERIGLADGDTPVALRWEAHSEAASVSGYALLLELPGVDPGEYTIELSMHAYDQAPLTVRRTLHVVER